MSDFRLRRTEKLASPILRVDPDGGLHHITWTVRVVGGPDQGRALEVKRPVVVGGGEAVDLRLTDSSVSGQHVELDPRPDGVYVKDLGSTNGTLIGGARVEAALVASQAVISIGRTLLALSMTDEREDGIEGPTEFEGLVGGTAVMRRLFGLVEKLAVTETPVLLLGETGTGKDGLARALHLRSARKKEPFVIVDCGAIAPQLVESELFGHARGAFSGAVTDRPGAFLEAEGGTLFLDEVGELPLELQPRLLRALEARQVKRLGEDRPRSVDVRVIAATHRALNAEVQAGRFRPDLYFRLAVAALRVPPLRERREDIPLLVRALLVQLGRESFELSSELITRLSSYDWPGNVRELRNVVARAVVSDEVSLEHVLNPAPPGTPVPSKPPASSTLEVPFKEAKERLVDNFTREYLTALQQKHGGNVTQMARASGLARTYLHDLLARHGLRGSDT
ncbi:MAG: sigma 54-interacting transcriptional regulator [Myxococcales bacterium]|nr:sigma 54-interacting transcriptional regulator [Myxococcales bacterium]